MQGCDLAVGPAKVCRLNARQSPDRIRWAQSALLGLCRRHLRQGNAVFGGQRHIACPETPVKSTKVQVLQAHSWSEVVAGLALGGAVSAAALAGAAVPAARLRPLVAVALLLWLALVPFALPASQSHLWLTRLALAMSGHAAPFVRGQ